MNSSAETEEREAGVRVKHEREFQGAKEDGVWLAAGEMLGSRHSTVGNLRAPKVAGTDCENCADE